jgi:hypothetical protein
VPRHALEDVGRGLRLDQELADMAADVFRFRIAH